MPVEVIQEYDNWRRVRDWEGVEGWVLGALLSGRRSVRVAGSEIVAMHARADGESRVVARVEPGVMGRLVACPRVAEAPGGWCLAELGGLRGWLPRARLWGVYPDEIVD
jgi:SH3-like domain-containing protein